jgi:hypothetical protein
LPHCSSVAALQETFVAPLEARVVQLSGELAAARAGAAVQSGDAEAAARAAAAALAAEKR